MRSTSPGDEVTARVTDAGVRIDDISNDHGRLPRDAARNTAGVAARALLDAVGDRRGVALSIRKGLPLASGLGGSAASAAAAVVAVDALFGLHSPVERLVSCALEGERLGAGSAHADNIAPCLCGGFVLVRCAAPPDIVRLPVPAGLTAVVVHPDLEIETAMARALVGETVALRDAVQQWANLGALVDALHRADFDLIARCARGSNRGATPRPAGPGPRRDQAGGARRRGPRVQPVGIGTVALRAVPQPRRRPARRRRDDGRRAADHRRRHANLRLVGRAAGRPGDRDVRYVTTRGQAPATTLEWALFDGLAPDGSLYVPESIDCWTPAEIDGLPSMPLDAIGVRVLRPYTAGEIPEPALAGLVADALNFPIPLTELEPGIHVLELFHGPTLAFKDIGARVMARLISALHDQGAPTSVLVATSGDTGSAVAHAFYRVPHTRVIVLYPDGRVSRQQQAQMTMFNAEPDTNVRAYAVAGNFDDCQRLVKAASADAEVLERIRITSANSINVGRLLPQMVYYFHAVAQLAGAVGSPGAVVSTPSGNFGNLTAGLMAKRAGLPIARFVAATNVNDVVPSYLSTGRYEPRPSKATIANAMDVGHPSNFDRMLWMYGHDVEAMRRDVIGSRHEDARVAETIRRVYETRGYLLDPHSAIAYLGLTTSGVDVRATTGVFLATAHPAKFHDVVEAIIGRPIDKPAPLAAALARPQHIMRIDATLDAVKGRLFE